MGIKKKIALIVEAKGASKASADVDKVNDSLKKTDKTSKQTSKSSSSVAQKFKKIGTAAKVGAAAVAGMAAVYAKQAINTTVGFARSTAGLSRALGMTTEKASQWVAVAKSRDMDPSKLQAGFTKVSTSVKAAMDGSKGALKSFKELGVSQKDLAKGSKNFDYLLDKVGNGFKNLKGGVNHAALAQKLFGKGGQSLVPILRGGAEGIKEQLDLAKKYGVVLDDGTKDGAMAYVQQQREMQMANMGLQLAVGKHLIPELLKVMQHLPGLINTFRKNADMIKLVAKVIIGLVVATKLITTITTIWGAAAKVVTGITKGWALAQKALNIAMSMNPIGLVVVGIMLLVGAAILAYRKIEWFRNGVNAAGRAIASAFRSVVGAVKSAIGFIGKHWKKILLILTGPVGIAVLLVRKHFGRVVAIAKSIPGKVKKALAGMWDGMKTGFKSAINWIIGKWNGFELSIGPISMPGPVPDIPKVSFSTPNIPMLAQGGQVHGVGSRWISGEAGPELGEVTSTGVKVTPLGGDSIGSDEIVLKLEVNLDGRRVGEGIRRVAMRDMLATSPA
jgi:hypothetical protein